MARKTLSVWGTLIIMGACAFACSEGEKREASSGSAIETDPRTSTGSSGSNSGTGSGSGGTDGDGTGVGTGTGTGDGTVGSGDGGQVEPTDPGGGGSQLLGKTLEQCTAESSAWIAVVESGAQPAVCGEALVNWCCVQGDVLARFPAQADALKVRFDQNTSDGYKLYHCSSNGANKTTFHFGKIASTSTAYRTVFVEGAFPVDIATPTDPCPAMATDDLKTGVSLRER